MDHKPGHFHLPLTILRSSLDQRDIQLKKDRLSDQLNNPDEVECTKLALLNLLSMFEYALRQTDQARNAIQEVLNTDPHNLNALQNLAHINKKLGLESKAETLEAEIAKLQGNINTTSDPDVKARVARSMAEQAFALTYDCFDKYKDDKGTEQIQRYQRADPLYQRAIEIGNDVVEAEERMTWYFFKGFNHHQICGQCVLLTDVKEMLTMTKHLGESIASYKEVLHQEPTPLYKAQTLVNLQCVLARTRTNYYVQQHSADISRFEDQVATLLQGEGSVKHAIDLVKNNHRVLNTMACALKYENFEEAEATVRASLETESDPKINWYGYHLRGDLTLEIYVRNTKARPYSQRDQGNMKLLEKSISDFKSCQEGMHLSKNYYLLGKSTMKLAEAESAGATPQSAGSSDKLIQALDWFNEALKWDQGQKDPKIHAFRAECLKRLKEDKQAVESWKRAVELDKQSTTYWGNIRSLLSMLLNQCRKTSDSEDFQPVVAETATYLKLALSKYETVCDRFIPQLIEQFPEEFLHAANYFIITNDLPMARTSWEYVDQTFREIRGPFPQEIEERRRRIGEDIEEREDVGTQEPRATDHEQTADSDQREEGATGEDILDELLPATEEQRAFMPLQVEKAQNAKGFHYDFFVIHSARDAEWVNYTLLASLEGEHRLKGCIADRDFQLGKCVLDNITASIKQSAKVLIILTPHLVQSKWCKHEMEKAIYAKVEAGTESVIPVLWKDCEVPDELKNITYLDAREHFDWEHLLRDIQK